MNTLVIIGNGFDLNIGLKTSYRDFMESPECFALINNRNNYLLNRIFNNFKLQNWVDIEAELKSFARDFNGKSGDYKKHFKIEYNEFIDAFMGYMFRVEDGINGDENVVLKNSLAARLLRTISLHPLKYDIFSFNYTDLNKLATASGCKESLYYQHMHGSLAGKSIIIGFEDNVNNVGDFCFMIKTFSRGYASHYLRRALQKARDVIIFGHSLGTTDYQYFSNFFLEKSSPDLLPEKSVKISIVTANEDSKLDILEQLRRMNNNQTNLLFDQNEVNIYCSQDYKSQIYFHHFLEGLRRKDEVESLILGDKVKK